MVNHLHDSMVSTQCGSVDTKTAQSDGHSSPPLTLAQVIASIRESRVEQTELLRLLVTVSNAHNQIRSTYVGFLATQTLTFTEASELLEANHWVSTIESKFELLNCTETQKTPFAAQQLLGDARAGGPVSPPLILPTKCSGPSFTKLSVCNTSQHASWRASTESSCICCKVTNQCTTTPSYPTASHSMHQSRLTPLRRRNTISWTGYRPNCRSTLCSALMGLSWI
jgi:hypothetical protein